MTQDLTTYYVWIGGSCDYGNKERAGGAAIVIEHGGSIIRRDVISDLNTTEFRMMLTLMVKVMNELPEGSDIIFLTNAAYIQNFDKEPTSKSANPDLIALCIKSKQRHNNVSVKIVSYHKSPLLIETHDTSTEAMKKLRTELMKQREQRGTCSNYAESRQKKTESQYNRQNKKVAKLKATLCIITVVMMLVCGCSSNNKNNSTLDTEQTDSVTQEITPALSETTDAHTPSIFDELANNMVCVEVDTGSFYICKYEVTQKLWKEVMGNNPSEMQGDDLPAGIILPMLCMADIIAVAYYKRIADWKAASKREQSEACFDYAEREQVGSEIKVVAKLLPTAILGFFLAIGVDNVIPTGQFRQLMGWTLMLALAVMIWSEVFGRENRWMKKWWYAAIFGLLGGFTTMIGNAAGPVMSVYLLSMRKEKMEYIGINAWFFLVVNLLKVPLQAFVWDNITWDSLILNLSMLPVIGIGALIGIRIVKLLPERVFRRFIQIVTVISVILMVI